jgi:hypothetical protein
VPSSEFGIFKDPRVRVFQYATLCVLDALLVLAGICRSQVLETNPILGIIFSHKVSQVKTA